MRAQKANPSFQLRKQQNTMWQSGNSWTEETNKTYRCKYGIKYKIYKYGTINHILYYTGEQYTCKFHCEKQIQLEKIYQLFEFNVFLTITCTLLCACIENYYLYKYRRQGNTAVYKVKYLTHLAMKLIFVWIGKFMVVTDCFVQGILRRPRQ